MLASNGFQIEAHKLLTDLQFTWLFPLPKSHQNVLVPFLIVLYHLNSCKISPRDGIKWQIQGVKEEEEERIA